MRPLPVWWLRRIERGHRGCNSHRVHRDTVAERRGARLQRAHTAVRIRPVSLAYDDNEEEDRSEHIKTFGDGRRAQPRAARALHGGRRRRVRRPLRRPSPGLLAADRRRHRLRGLRLAVGRRLRHRLRQQGGAHRADARRSRRARRRRVDHGRDHAPDLVRHGRAGAGARRPPGARRRSATADFAPQRKLVAARRVAARHGRLGQPLRQPDGGRGGPDLGRRPLRLARLRPQDRVGLPRARAGPAASASGRTRARWTRRRCSSRSARSSASRTSRRWSWPASTPTPAATSWSTRCSRSSAPRRRTRCTTTTTSRGGRSTSAARTGSSARAARRPGRARRASSAARWATSRSSSRASSGRVRQSRCTRRCTAPAA